MSWLLQIGLPRSAYGVCISFPVIVLSKYIPKSGIAGSYGSSIFSWFFFFFFLFTATPVALEVPGLGIEMELQLWSMPQVVAMLDS